MLRDNKLYYFREEQGTASGGTDKRGRDAVRSHHDSAPIGFIDLRSATHIGPYVDDASTPLPTDASHEPISSSGDKPAPHSNHEGGGIMGRSMTTLNLNLGKAFTLPTLWDYSRYFFIKSDDTTYWLFAGMCPSR